MFLLFHIFPCVQICAPTLGTDNLVLLKDEHLDLVLWNVCCDDAALAAFAQEQDLAVLADRKAFTAQAECLFYVFDLLLVVDTTLLKRPFVLIADDMKRIRRDR